jgi:cell division inhibitor SepF
MSKDSGKKSFLDYFKVKDSDDYDDDDFFDDDDDDDEDDYDDDEVYSYKKPAKKSEPVKQKSSYSPSSYQTSSTGYTGQTTTRKQTKAAPQQDSKLVSFDTPQRRPAANRPLNEVYVIKPVEFDDAQTVSDFLKAGKTIVINMEGVQLDPAQRIIDFIGGACYGLGGDLKAISANIFIAAPNNIEVSGDLRDEILNESTLSPQLGKY